MGWVGVAIVVATTCFLLYRHPPATWFPEPPQPAADQARPSEINSAQNEKAAPRRTEGKSTAPVIKLEPRAPAASDDPAEETQTTPKASPSNGAPLPVVPSFQLNGEETEKKRTPQEAQEHSKSRTTTGPSLAPPSLSIPTPSNAMNKSTPSPTPTSSQTPAANKATDASLMPPPPPPSRFQPPSAQRQPPRLQPQPSSSLAPPPGRFAPPRPSVPGRVPSSSAGSTLSPPPSAASSLRVPPGMGMGSRPNSMNSLSPTTVTLKPAKKASQRAILEPGFSPLDWAALTSNPNHKLRGANMPPGLIKVTPSMLKAQHGRKGMDAWTSYQGKVYNVTPYLGFHPGGKGELLRGAGKDSGKLFLEIHPWVNWDAILGECLVGILVSEHEAVQENALDSMD
ncbi:uncharacterized protein BDV14DRAFT_9025 [Aspergillus stella-maris]|uniref:uncharacterized protein n=1 Tax=Aspergillus stella-maris TaxID=1810926 RepID=UPI003CCCCB9E